VYRKQEAGVMAEKLADMPSKRGRAQKHPWDEWADGSVWKITKDQDFSGAVESMRTQLYGKARQLNKELEILVDKAAGTITFRMTDKS
jgi:hypothetical protein